MYAKLAFRNGCRCFKDYALYLVTMVILSAIITFSNLLSNFSGIVDAASSSSLPLIISLIMVFLLHYMNNFMLSIRGRELATYILLGMNKHSIAKMFVMEFFLLGSFMFIIGAVMGSILFIITMQSFVNEAIIIEINMFMQSLFISIIYFFVIQAITNFLIYMKISKLQIKQLLITKQKNNIYKSNSKPLLWSALFLTSFGLLVILLCIIIYSKNEEIVMFSISLIFIPTLFSIFAFYKSILLWLNWIRKNHINYLYSGNRLHLTSKILSNAKTDVRLYTILSVCLLFSLLSFVFGIAMKFLPTDSLFAIEQSEWMSFVQISMSITFIVIYFSLQSVKQIIDIKKNQFGFKVMGYLGKSKIQLISMIIKETCLKFFIPTIMFAIIIFSCVFPLNHLLNDVLIKANIVIYATSGFLLCFCCLYLIYLVTFYLLIPKSKITTSSRD